MSPTARGGNDAILGDPKEANAGGNDEFLFAGLIGRDLVFDFRDGEDLLNLLAYGFGDGGLGGGGTFDFADLDFTVAGGNTVIDIGTSFGLSGPGLGDLTVAVERDDDGQVEVDQSPAPLPTNRDGVPARWCAAGSRAMMIGSFTAGSRLPGPLSAPNLEHVR
jgi:hypothetical protein